METKTLKIDEAEPDHKDGFTKEQLDFLKAEAEKYKDIEPYEWWNDEEFVAELDQISADLESGKDKGISWEEVKKQLTPELAAIRNKARNQTPD